MTQKETVEVDKDNPYYKYGGREAYGRLIDLKAIEYQAKGRLYQLLRQKVSSGTTIAPDSAISLVKQEFPQLSRIWLESQASKFLRTNRW